MVQPPLDADAHCGLAAALFNRTWELLELPSRSAEQDDEMIHTAHASRYHWGETGRLPNMAGGEWQCSRVYAVLGRAEPALWHARRCLVICEAAGIGDYGIAAAYEGMARAELLAENLEAARSWKAKASQCARTSPKSTTESP